MKAEPQKEHQWLQRLVGEWKGEFECNMGPDQPVSKTKSTEVVRCLDGLWTVGDGEGECPTSGPVQTRMTLGYDPQKKKFVGTFIASVMTHMWIYEGSLDATGQRLVLDTEGPDFSGGTGMVRYQDIFEFVNDYHRTLRSQVHGKDGEWHEFMVGHYRRTK